MCFQEVDAWVKMTIFQHSPTTHHQSLVISHQSSVINHQLSSTKHQSSIIITSITSKVVVVVIVKGSWYDGSGWWNQLELRIEFPNRNSKQT